MKCLTFILLLLLVSPNELLSQKEDYFWMFGYSSDTSTMEFGGTNIDFNTTPPDVHYEFRSVNFLFTNISICDSLGSPLFYSNGITISNSIDETMENGDNINPGPYREDWVDDGYNLVQGALALRASDDSNIYYVFHEERTFTPEDPEHTSKVFTLYYSKIDMTANNGLGTVLEKNVPIIQDTLDFGKLTSTKHGNGKDWWILVPEFDSNRYYRILLTSEGIHSIDSQAVGDFVYGAAGQSTFSPDGTKYVRYSLKTISIGNFLSTYDFDRCTGLLSNPVQYNIIDEAFSGGVAISPNSQFLYVPSYNYVYQYDLHATDIEATKDTVAVYDGFLAPYFPTTFFIAQLAPNGKIYINSKTAVNTLHVIHSPNEPGDACNFEQHGLQLPTFNAFSLPNFPNYRLGPAPQSDTCSIVSELTELEQLGRIQVYPNPADEYIIIDFESLNTSGVWSLFNSIGQLINSVDLSSFELDRQINLSNNSPGIYYWRVRTTNGKLVDGGKLIIH